MELAEHVAAVAARVVASGAISTNGHGNVSLRVPGRDEIMFSTAPTLHGLRPSDVARVSLDGSLLAGELPPINASVVAMHTELYKRNDETGCVIHTLGACRPRVGQSRGSPGARYPQPCG